MKRVPLLFIVLFFIAIQSGCSMKKMATSVVGKVAIDGMVAIESEEDLSLARESGPALIKTFEVLSYGNPNDARALTLLAQAYGQYAFGFFEDDILASQNSEKELLKARYQADLFYRRGKDFGIRALSTKNGMKKVFNSAFPDFKKAVSRLGKKDVPTLFWTAFNWANYLNLHLDDPATIAELPRIEALIDRIIELDDKFYFGSAHAFKGVIIATKPKMLGGNPTAAESEFKRAMDIAPNYLMTKVLFAQYFAKQTQNQALFKNTLTEVIDSTTESKPSEILANKLAKRRARLLLDLQKKLF